VHPLDVAGPHGILVLHRDDTVIAASLQGRHHPAPVDLSQARDAVPPPAAAPRLPVDQLAEHAVLVAGVCEHLDVLGLHVQNPVGVLLQRGDRVDAEPHQVRRVVVQPEPEVAEPAPELGRVGQVRGIAVGVPSLHRAVLDDQPDVAGGGVLHQRRDHLLGDPEVLHDRAGDVTTDERPDQAHAEECCGVDAASQVLVRRLADGEVLVQVVLVVGDG
jgi:hypothetical protein